MQSVFGAQVFDSGGAEFRQIRELFRRGPVAGA